MALDPKAFELAAEVERVHGDAAEAFVEARIAEAAKAVDQHGLSLWLAVRATVAQLHKIAKPPSTPYCASYGELANRSLSNGRPRNDEISG